jgi:hypothetical protein
MSRVIRVLAILAVLLGLGLRAVEVHSHDGDIHPDSCALCRGLQTPLAAPLAAAEAPAVLVCDSGSTVPASETSIAEKPVLAGHLLRAPPSA